MNLFEKQRKEFQDRHIGPDENETLEMLKTIGKRSLDELISETIPPTSAPRKNSTFHRHKANTNTSIT